MLKLISSGFLGFRSKNIAKNLSTIYNYICTINKTHIKKLQTLWMQRKYARSFSYYRFNNYILDGKLILVNFVLRCMWKKILFRVFSRKVNKHLDSGFLAKIKHQEYNDDVKY
jgi:hypothetical protein